MATQWKNPLPGVKTRKLSTDFEHVRIHYSADPQKNEQWAKRYSVKYFGMDSPKWRREMEIDYNAAEGQQVYPMLSRQLHDEQVTLNDDWSVFRVIDNGIRHPTVCLWIAINSRGDRHVFAEYYATNKSIGFNCNEIIRRTVNILGTHKVLRTFIDPETRKRTGAALKTIRSEYEKFFPTICADNSRAGYDAVMSGLMSTVARKAIWEGNIDGRSYLAREYMKDFRMSQAELLAMAEKPALTFDMRFTQTCFSEMRNLRWAKITGDATDKAAPEKVMDKDDDGPDCVRYGMQSIIKHCQPPSRVITVSDILNSYKSRSNNNVAARAYI